MNKSENSIVRDMTVLILGYGVLLWIVLMFFVKNRIYVSSGLVIGIMLGEFMLVHMQRVLQVGLDLGARAEKYVLMHSCIRYLAVVIVYGIVIFAHLGSPLACFTGMLSLKVAAYLQPFYSKLKKKEK